MNPKTVASRHPFHAGRRFRGFAGSLPLRPARLLAPCTDRTGTPQPAGAFTSRLSTGRSPFPLLDITTTATGPPLLAGLSPARMTASFAALTCRTTFLPARDLPHTWVNPRKVNEVPSVSGWSVPFGRLLRKESLEIQGYNDQHAQN